MNRRGEGFLNTVVQSTRGLLEEIGGVEPLQLELDYYRPEKLRPEFPTINHIYVRLCDSIRNTSRMRMVITDSRFELISERLLTCSLDSICKSGFESMTEVIRDKCRLSDEAQERRRSWGIFKQGCIQGACYLDSFRNAPNFYEYVDRNVETVDAAWNLALEVDRIKGIGPALACDFLKEVGVDCFGKPDVHIKNIFGKLQLIGEDKKDRDAFEVIWRMADICGCSAAVVDKMLWMASSGRWDRTLDRQLPLDLQMRAQKNRKQLFGELLNQLRG